MKLNKQKILLKITAELQRQLETMKLAAFNAKAEATSEESKAENKYDTRGLEASYLAGAQAQRAGELKLNLERIKELKPRDYDSKTAINLGACVCLLINGNKCEVYYMLPSEGGVEVEVSGVKVVSLSPHSPLGREVFNQHLGHCFELNRRSKLVEFEIIELI